MQYLHFMTLARWFVALSGVPFDWARARLQRQPAVRQRATLSIERPLVAPTFGIANGTRAVQAIGPAALFDLARAQYAVAVQAGLIERSLLASGAFERRLGLLERLTLGPWARRV